jgi:nitroimidazol reductase NimA-like FMN-containing flavoprotein (pyridoxamine 5'-phosphate oxidase superfamily)
MSPQVMTREEREAFLAGPYVGMLAVARDGRAPLAVPLWYDYQPGGEVLIWMGRDTLKHKAIISAGRFSLLVQQETPPYKYVTAEGPATVDDQPPTRDQALRIVRRYQHEEDAVAYVNSVLGPAAILVRMRPQKWLSSDFSKA